MELSVCKASIADLNRITEIYACARAFMAANGNPTQWKKGHPSRDMIEKDISLGRSFVCLKDEKIECVFMYEEGEDPTYSYIEDGEWPNDFAYGVLHRIASAGNVKGIASFCLSWCYEKCKNLRADTHRDNKVMQRVLQKNGFKRCGIIYIADGSPRIAYQKTEK